MNTSSTYTTQMNISRRTAIKSIGAGLATAAIPSSQAADDAISSINTDTFSVQLAHQWGKDSLVAIVKNTSSHPATITQFSPGAVVADYGRFNFSQLTDNGPLTLAAGEEAHVPFTIMGTPVKPYGHFDNRLQKIIRDSLTINTKNKVAKVTTALSTRLV